MVMYEDMLAFWRNREQEAFHHLLKDFGRHHHRAATEMGMLDGACQHPHDDHLLQAVAHTNATVVHLLEAQYPEISQGILRRFAPHYLSLMPAMTLARCVLNPSQGKWTKGYPLPKGTLMEATQDVQGVTCRMQTTEARTLWPVEVVSAHVTPPEQVDSVLPRPSSAQAVLSLTLRCSPGLTFAELALRHLELCLHGPLPHATDLYELLLRHTQQIYFYPSAGPEGACQPFSLPRQFRPLGLNPEAGLLPYTVHTLMGFRWLLEYFLFPRKFLFVALDSFERLAHTGCGNELTVQCWLRQVPRFPHLISADSFRLGCVPLINLFPRRAEPIRVQHRQSEYLVIPDAAHPEGMEVSTIQAVESVTSPRGQDSGFAPFYGFTYPWTRHAPHTFWAETRRPGSRPDDAGTEVSLTFVDLLQQPIMPQADTLRVSTMCTNRDLIRQLRLGNAEGDFVLEGARDVVLVQALEPLTAPIRIPLNQPLSWRLLAHLSLHYTSLYDHRLDPAVLKSLLTELLALHDLPGTHQRQIEGITAVTCRPIVRPLHSLGRYGVCPGTEITIQCDETRYQGGELFLLASVLNRYFGVSAALNTCSQLVVTTDQRVAQEQEPWLVWEPRLDDEMRPSELATAATPGREQ